MLISTAFAQAAGGAPAAMEQFQPFIMIGMIFIVFYMLVIRPQNKKMKAHNEMLGKLRRGDKVVCCGGMIATVSKVISETEVEVEIASGVKVKVVRNTIGDVLTKPEPVSPDSSGDADKTAK